MSVRTAADEHRDKALANINDAIVNIAAVVIENVWGWDEYNKEYYEKLRRALDDLISVRDGSAGGEATMTNKHDTELLQWLETMHAAHETNEVVIYRLRLDGPWKPAPFWRHSMCLSGPLQRRQR